MPRKKNVAGPDAASSPLATTEPRSTSETLTDPNKPSSTSGRKPRMNTPERLAFIKQFSYIDGPADLQGSRMEVLARLDAKSRAVPHHPRPWPINGMFEESRLLHKNSSPLRFEPWRQLSDEGASGYLDVHAYIPPKSLTTDNLQSGGVTRQTAQETGAHSIVGGMYLSEEDAARPLTQRPMIGPDLSTLMRKHRVQQNEYAACLGFNNVLQYLTIAESRAVLPTTLEMLARMYAAFPWPPNWANPSVLEVYSHMYDPIMAEAASQGRAALEQSRLRLACYRRFTAALDRTSASAYRWIEKRSAPRPVISLLLRKITQQDHPRLTLEALARLVYFLRGGDFDKYAPHPTIDDLQIVKPGRVPRFKHDIARPAGTALGALGATLPGAIKVGGGKQPPLSEDLEMP